MAVLAPGELLDFLKNGLGSLKPLITGQIILGVLLDVGPRIWTKMGQGRHLGLNIQGDLVSQGHVSAGLALRDPDRERLLTFSFWEVLVVSSWSHF